MGKIKSGLLAPGEELESTRQLAKLYQCHRFTIMSACQDLMAEGWIESIERSRYKVSSAIPITESVLNKNNNKKSNLKPKVIPEFDLERVRYGIEFWGGQPDLKLFPKNEFRRILSAALKRTKPSELNYGLTNGLPTCIKEVSNYLRRTRNLKDKELVMTNGSQEALYLAFQCFLKAGDKIAIEKKGYPPAWRLFESLGAILIPIEVDDEGLNTDDLHEKMKKHNIKMIYITPLHQYPTTVTLSPRRRQKLIQLAENKSIPILEDDYDNEFHYIGPPPPPICSETDLGIYICSFSKVLFPGARLGVIACAPELQNHFSYQKFILSRQTDSLIQIGLAAWIRDGGFERHLRRMRRIYESRYFFMLDQLTNLKKNYEIDWVNPNGGMSIWVNTFKDSKIISNLAKKKDVLFQFESSMDYSGISGTHLRIGFAGVDEAQIKQGFEILKVLLKKK
jgi:GntR family transcriptional regulator/MocR family aminotransferase